MLMDDQRDVEQLGPPQASGDDHAAVRPIRSCQSCPADPSPMTEDCPPSVAGPAPERRSPVLFLSHAGLDTERALALADAIETSPEARAAGLEVWVDQRPRGANRLIAGAPWQEQLEDAIARRSTAFGLLLTKEGARNWVRLEVRAALDRVIAAQRKGSTYPFVPIVVDDIKDLEALPPFARQYQGVRLTPDGRGLADLVRVAT